MRNVFTMNVLSVRELIDVLTASDDDEFNELAVALDECQGAVHSGEVDTATLILRIIE